jgi:hypothetical protein
MDRCHPRTVTDLVEMLVDALTRHGLSAEPFGAAMVWATNREADPPGDDARGVRMSPGLRQTVICRPDRDGRLGWWWVWTSRDGEPEYEWFCPAGDIDKAANAIARVLTVRMAPVEQVGG